MLTSLIITALMKNTLEEVRVVLTVMREEDGKVGRNINWSKTKIMFIDAQLSQQPPLTVEVCQNQIIAVKDFTYLVSIFSSDGSVEVEINTKIAKATSIPGDLIAQPSCKLFYRDADIYCICRHIPALSHRNMASNHQGFEDAGYNSKQRIPEDRGTFLV